MASSTTADSDGNGQIDQITIQFSETVDITDGNASDALPGYSVNNYTIADADYGASGVSNLNLRLVESGSADIGVTPTVSYDQGTSNSPTVVDADGHEQVDRDSETPIDGASPAVSAVSLSNDGSNLAFSFETDEQLGGSASDVSVTVDGPSTADVYSFDRMDFDESGSGPYTYALSATQAYDDGDGTYTASVDDALDAVGNDGADGSQSDSYTLDTTAPTISSVSLDNDGSNNLAFSFEADEQLGGSASNIAVTVDGPNSADVYSFDRTDFGESGSGPYTYALSTTQAYDDGDGAYTAAVDDALDAAGNDGADGNQTDSYLLYPDEVSASVSRAFGDASGSGDYRLVALPGAVDRPLGDAVEGEAGTEWTAWWDDGSSVVEFDGSSTFDFRTGRGFWLISRQDWTFSETVPTVDLESDTAATIPVNDGWTIIANPLDKAVDWGAVERANGGDLHGLWPFGGAFDDTTTTFVSAAGGRAYYFFNDDSSLDSLTIPYPGAPVGKPSSKEVSPEESSAEPPMLALSARAASSEGPASTVRVGLVNEEGAETRLLAPPGRFEAVSLRIAAPERREATPKEAGRARVLMAERRLMDGEGETFDLRLTSQVDRPIEIEAGGLDGLDGQAAALLDPEGAQTYDLGTGVPIRLDPGNDTRQLQLAIGSTSYVEGQKEEVLPTEVRLTSYPNPVRGQGTLEYALPEASDVTLRVYDVLGREVATLATGTKRAGRHTVQLDTDRLASGVYFGRLRAGGQTRTQKMTVVQ